MSAPTLIGYLMLSLGAKLALRVLLPLRLYWCGLLGLFTLTQKPCESLLLIYHFARENLL